MRARAILVVVLVWLAPAGRAESAPGGNTFSLELFRPALDSKGYVTVDASELLGHLDFSLGLVSSFARNVLTLTGAGNDTRLTVEDLVTPQLQAALGLWKWAEVGVSLPVHILYGSRAPGDLHFSGQSIGDVGVHVKTRFSSAARAPVGLGASFSLYLPSGDAHDFLGEGQVTLRPELIVDKEFGRTRRLRLALNAGALVRPAKHSFTDDGTQQTRALGSQLTYGVGLAYAAVPQRLELVGEAFGYLDLTGEATGHPLEALLAAKVYLAKSSYFTIGGGAGLLPRTITAAGGMTGSPEVRVFVGFVFEPSIGDRDGDGIKDDVDKCPDDPEDFDDFEDADGCPDPDNDKDGLYDRDDQCPNEPGPAENHGCPWPDSDGDRVIDKDDECPHQPGPKENNGCPPRALTRLRGGVLVTLDPIYFETNKAIIKPISYPTLDAVAETMQANPQLLSFEIQGHADERGDDAYNLRLTEERAAAVKRYLIDKGVLAERLRSHGYGETRPICAGHDEACWSQNRRVQFIILRRSDGPR